MGREAKDRPFVGEAAQGRVAVGANPGERVLEIVLGPAADLALQ